jgi:hypothetical protein
MVSEVLFLKKSTNTLYLVRFAGEAGRAGPEEDYLDVGNSTLVAPCHDDVAMKKTLLEAIGKNDLPGFADDMVYENVTLIADPDTLNIDT